MKGLASTVAGRYNSVPPIKFHVVGGANIAKVVSLRDFTLTASLQEVSLGGKALVIFDETIPIPIFDDFHGFMKYDDATGAFNAEIRASLNLMGVAKAVSQTNIRYVPGANLGLFGPVYIGGRFSCGIYIPKWVPVVGDTELAGISLELSSKQIYADMVIATFPVWIQYVWGEGGITIGADKPTWLGGKAPGPTPMSMMGLTGVSEVPEGRLIVASNWHVLGTSENNSIPLGIEGIVAGDDSEENLPEGMRTQAIMGGPAPIVESNGTFTEHKLRFEALDTGIIVLRFVGDVPGYEGLSLDDITVLDPLGEEYPLILSEIAEDGDGNFVEQNEGANCIFQQLEPEMGDDGVPAGLLERTFAIGIADPRDGVWTVNTRVSTTSVALVNAKSGRRIKDFLLSENEDGELEVKWDVAHLQGGEKVAFAVCGIVEDPETGSPMKEQTGEPVKEAGRIFVEGIDPYLGKTVITLPEYLESGEYYLRAILYETDDIDVVNYHSVYTEDSIIVTNPHEPRAPNAVHVQAIGSGNLLVEWDSVEGADGYYVQLLDGYGHPVPQAGAVQVEASQGDGDTVSVVIGGVLQTLLPPDPENISLFGDDDWVMGEQSGLLSGSSYGAAVTAYKQGGLACYYSSPAKSGSTFVPEPKPPALTLSLVDSEGNRLRETGDDYGTVYLSGTSDVTLTVESDQDLSKLEVMTFKETWEGGGGTRSRSLRTVPLSLDEGSYRLSIYAMNDAGDEAEEGLRILVDTTPPGLFVETPCIEAEEMIVTGVSEPGAKVTVNGERCTLDEDGTFEARIHVGNVFTKEAVVVASDEVGNTVTGRQIGIRTTKLVGVKIQPEGVRSSLVTYNLALGESQAFKVFGIDEEGNRYVLPNEMVDFQVLSGEGFLQARGSGEWLGLGVGKAIIGVGVRVAGFEDVPFDEGELTREGELQTSGNGVLYDSVILNVYDPEAPLDTNQAPQVVSLIEDQKVSHGGTLRVDLSSVFMDPEGEILVLSQNQAQADIGSVEGSEWVYTPAPRDEKGDYYVTVFATDPGEKRASCTFKVTLLTEAEQRLEGEQNVTIVVPTTGEIPQTEITGTEFDGEIAWEPDDASFKARTVYKASVTLTAKSGYTFASDAVGLVNDAQTENSEVSQDGLRLTFSHTFPETPDSMMVGIEAKLVDSSKEYRHGDTVAADDITVTARYNDASTGPLGSERYTIVYEDGSAFKKGDGKFTVKVGDFSEDVSVIRVKGLVPTKAIFDLTDPGLIYNASNQLDSIKGSVSFKKGIEGVGALTVIVKDSSGVTAEAKDPGLYSVYVTLGDGEVYDEATEIYVGDIGIGKLDISHAIVSLDSTLVYSGDLQSPTITSVKVGGIEVEGYDLSGNENVDAGNYELTITAKPDSSFEGFVRANWVIAKKELILTGTHVANKVYDGTTVAVINPGTLSGIVGSDDVSVVEESISGVFDTQYAGTGKTVTTTEVFTLQGIKAGNYTLQQPIDVTGHISAAVQEIVLTAPERTVVKDGVERDISSWASSNAPDANVIFSLAGTSPGVTLSGTNLTVDSFASVTTFTIKVNSGEINLGGTDDPEYSAASEATITVTVTSKPAQTEFSFSEDSVTKTYGDGAFTAAAAGQVTGSVVTYRSSDHGVAIVDAGGKVTVVGAGTAIITASASETPDYAEALDSYTLTVNPAKITIVANNKSVYTGSAVPELDYAVVGLVGDDKLATEPTVKYETAPNMAVSGTYNILVSGAAVPPGGNYEADIEYVPGTLTVIVRPSGGLPEPLLTIPGAGGSVQVSYTLSGSIASLSLPAFKVNELIAKTEGPHIVLDLSDVEGVTSVSLSKAALESFRETGFGIKIILPSGTLILDTGTLSSLVKQAPGDEVRFELKEVSLGDRVELAENDIVLDINIYSGNYKIETFDGTLEVEVPYGGALPVAVWHLDDEGKLHKMESTYVDGKVRFVLSHLSYYVVGHDTKWVNSFTDVKETDWFYNAVEYACLNNLMLGTAPDQFSPYVGTTRGMIVTILHRLEGTPGAGTECPFSDVAARAWYFDGVVWAARVGVVEGYGNGLFGPDDNITREQMAVILNRYARYKGYDIVGQADLSKYKDASSISDWAVGAMRWANASGLIQGDGANLLPRGNAERAQVAAILQRFIESLAR